jgi:hypothetical protein
LRHIKATWEKSGEAAHPSIKEAHGRQPPAKNCQSLENLQSVIEIGLHLSTMSKDEHK